MRCSSVVILILLFSCSGNGLPGDILPPEKIRPIIYDLLRADEFLNNFIMRDTSLKREKEAVKLYEQVFQIHKISSQHFYKSYRYYQANPDKNKILIDSLNALVMQKSGKKDTTNLQTK